MNYRKYEFDHVVLFLLISLQNKLTFSNLTDLDLREHLKSTQNIFFEFHFWWKIAKFLIWFFEQKFIFQVLPRDWLERPIHYSDMP